MAIQISAKQDYSYLFSSLNGSGSKNSTSAYGFNLTDYASIKNGSYGKLLKAYYNQDRSDTVAGTTAKSTSSLNKIKVDATLKKELTDIQTYADETKASAAALMEKGSKSVFKNEDMDKIYQAVSKFTEDYNTLMEKSQNSSSPSVARYAESMAYATDFYKDSLKEMGISIGANNQLSIDKDTFMKTDIDKIKSVFNSNNTLSYQAASNAAAIGNKAYSESNKSALYTANGTYSSMTASDLFNRIV